MAWTEPTVWEPGDPLTADRLNTEVKDNLLFLKKPDAAHHEADEASVYQTTSTTFTNVDSTDTEGKFRHTITVRDGDVLVGFMGMVHSNAGVTGSVLFNISVDGVDVAPDDGITGYFTNNSNLAIPISFVYLIPNLSAGSHVIRLRWKVSSASMQGSLYAGSGLGSRDVHPQFWVREL